MGVSVNPNIIKTAATQGNKKQPIPKKPKNKILVNNTKHQSLNMIPLE